MELKDIKKGRKVKLADSYIPKSISDKIFVKSEIYGIIAEDKPIAGEIMIYGYSGISIAHVNYKDLILIEEEYSLQNYTNDYGGSMIYNLDANTIKWRRSFNKELLLTTENDGLPTLIKIVPFENRYLVYILEQMKYSFTPRREGKEEREEEVKEFALNRFEGALQMLASIDMNIIKKEFICEKS